MNKKILVYLLPLILLACKKQNPQPELAKPLTSTISTNTNGHRILTTYSYNNSAHLWQETIKDETTGAVLYQEYRHKEGILYRSDIFNDDRKLSKIDYTVTSNMVTKMRYFEYDRFLNTELLFERNLEYQNGQLYKISTTAADGQRGEYTLFSFRAGNVTTVRTYAANGSLISTVEYEYDNKINPYLGQYGQLYTTTAYSKSNITKIVQTDHSTNSVTTTRYAYKYNQVGQPITQFLVGNPNKVLTTFNY